jgi:hypothetical protein
LLVCFGDGNTLGKSEKGNWGKMQGKTEEASKAGRERRSSQEMLKVS